MSSSLIAGVNRWTSADLGQASKVLDLKADPSNSDVAYALTVAGIYKTADGGQNWRVANDGLSDPTQVKSLLVTDDALYVSIGNTVFGSWDGAEHWQRRASLGSVFINVLAFDPRAGTLIAGTSGGVSYSIDAAATWVNVRTQAAGTVSSLVVSSNVALLQYDTYYADPLKQVHGAIRSTDGGKTWMTSPRSADFLYANASGPTIYGTMGRSVSVSDDGGDTWKQIAQPPPSYISALLPVDSGVYAATDSGVYLYNRAKQKWSLVGPAVGVHGLAIAGSATPRLFAVPQSGVITKTERDIVWTSADAGLPTLSGLDVAISNSEPATAYAAMATQVFRTEDAGQNWTPLPATGERVAISPNSSKVVYLESTAVFRTSDGGDSWKKVTSSKATALAIAPSDPATLYATLADGMAKSVDGGDNWASSMNGLIFDYYDWYYGFQATSLTVDPSNASIAYLGRYSGLYKTTDGGASWQDVSRKDILTSLVIDPMDSSTLYAGVEVGRGVRKSVDQGLSWTPAGLIDKQIHSLAIDGSHLYAASSDGHVYRSDDGGQRWDGFDEGLGNSFVSRIAVNPSGLLYAATSAGLYQFQIAGQDLQIERMPDTPLQLPDDQRGLLLPAVGSAMGAGGTSFSTDVTLTNTREAAQQVLVSWLPQAGGAEVPASFRLAILSGVTTVSDISARLGISGIGSLAFLPIAADGKVDVNASIDASGRIWAQLPDGLAPSSQSVAAVRGSALSDHPQLVVTHLRHDAEFRTNAGIVNLSNETRQFTIQINGARASNQVTVAVPPFSLVQMAVPDGDYGDLSLVALPDTATRWLLYASLIDRSNHATETFIAREKP